MQKKTCPNGHVYDPTIYGDHCPLCPAGAHPMAGHSGPETRIGGAPQPGGVPPMGGMPPRTFIAGGAPGAPGAPAGNPGMNVGVNAAGETNIRNQGMEPRGNGHTVIRRPPGAGGRSGADAVGKKLVGFLVTYSRDPNGRACNLYEGRNYIGRDRDNDVAFPDDKQMSGKHMSIIYRTVDKKFKFKDEMSTNGTFINKELLDEGELQNGDIIRVGSTIFIFLAIPDIS